MCDLFILPDETLPTPILLGRDFLQKAGIGLRYVQPISLNSNKNEIVIPEKIKRVHSNVCNSIEQINFSYRLYVSSFIENSLPASTVVSSLENESIIAIVKPENYSLSTLVVFDELPFAAAIDTDFNELNIGRAFGKDIYEKCLRLIQTSYLQIPRTNNTFVEHTMKIRLTTDSPLYCNPRRLSYREKEEVSKVIDDLLEKQIIRPSSSPYASPIVLVKKKNGELRMCIDYRALNKVTIRDNFPLPLIEDCLEYLDSKSCFSILDLKNCFHQVLMDPDSIPFTSFVTPFGQFEYDRMPFGLKNGPSVFQRFISTILNDMIRASEIVVYMDDILIATATANDHLTVLKKLLNRLAEHNLEISPSKCHFMQSSIDYLGYSADCSGISPNDSHVETLRSYPIPTNKRELQSCIGLFSYFRRFVQNFSRIAGPLYNLLKTNNQFDFDSDCLQAFIKLRDALCTAPVLSIYNSSRETELHTDASSHGFGAVLLQKNADDNKWHPVSYYSRRTSQVEMNYHSFELETLAIIYALRRFRVPHHH